MNIDIWIFIFIMVLTGAWTGYITNDVAIKMLFREYGFGRFKFGGVIVKTRKDLEKNLSKLVEKEIINHNTLKSQFHKPEVKEAISKTVVTFFNESIFENTQNMELAELPGFEKTIQNVLSFLREYLENNLTNTISEMSKNIDLSDIVSNEQAYNLSATIANQIVHILKEERILAKVVNDLYDNYHDVSIDEIVGEDITNNIIDNLKELLNNIFDEMRFKHDRDIHTLISKLYRDLDVDSFIETLEKYIGEKKVGYFISNDSLEKLYKLFTEYLKDSDSKESIEVFCDGLIIALKKIEKPIIELFSGDLRIEVEKFLENQLPDIIDKLIDLVQKNSHEIEELIETSIDQTIYDQQTIKRIILSAIRIFLIENFTQKYDIIDKIVEMLKGIDIEDLSKTISEQVVEILHQKSISSIIIELESNNILTAKLISSQVHRILTFLCERYLSKDIEHAEFLNKKINLLFNLNLKSFINSITVSLLTKQIIYNEDVVKFLKEKIVASLKGIAKLPIDNFVLKDKVSTYSEKLQDEIQIKLEKNYDNILDTVYKHLSKYFENNNVSSVISKGDKIEFKSDVITDVIIKSLRNVLDDNSKVKVHDLFNKINSIDNLSDNVINAIMDFLDNGLSDVLEGNIAKVVEDNIKGLSNKEVLEMMQEFMGTKLKPLTIIGAILGAIVGLFLGINGSSQHFSGFSDVIFNKDLLINIPIYALIGFLTNVIAIFFIFRPYKPIFGIKSAQGIIPKQIPILAKAMGKVVSNNLLSEDSINNMIVNNEKRLKDAFSTNIKHDNYKVLRAYMNENNQQFVNQTSNYVLKYLSENNSFLSTRIANELFNIDLKNIKTELLIEVFTKIFVEKLNDSTDNIENYLLSKFKSSKTIRELSEELNINTIEDKIDQLVDNEVIKFVDKFHNDLFLAQIMKNNRKKVDSLINKDLNSVIPDSTKLSIENFLYNLISNYLYSRDKQRSLSNYIITEITLILHNNDSIDELFGGRFIELVNYNMYTILEKIELTVKSWLNSHKIDINESVTTRVFNQLTVVQQVGYKAINGDKLIKETVYRIVEDKIPEFVSKKFESLNNEFNNFFENLGKIRLKDAKLELRHTELENYLSDVFESKEIEIKTRRFIHVVMNHFLSFKTATVFDIIDVHSTNDILYKFDDIFILLNKGIYNNLNNRKDKIVFDISLLINKFITREILSNRVRNLTLGLSKKDVNNFVANIITALNKNNFLYVNVFDLVEIVFKQFVNIPVEDLLDKHFLKQDIKKLIRKLSIDDNFERVLYQSTYNLFSITIEEFDNLVDDQLKERIIYDVMDSTYDVLSKYLIVLLQAVDLNEVTIREINNMEPKQIKELFDSLGSKYFRKLETYGFFGGVFAVNVISLIIFLSYIFRFVKKSSYQKS